MNGRVSRQIRKHVLLHVEPNKSNEAIKSLKALWRKGFLRLSK